MDISTACNIFGISDIHSIDYDSINKIYRVLAKKYHPDNCGNTDDIVLVNSARDLLIEYKDKATCRKNTITLDEFKELKKDSIKFRGKIVEFDLLISLEDSNGIVVEQKVKARFAGNSNDKSAILNVGFISDTYIVGNSYKMTIDINGDISEIGISNSFVIFKKFIERFTLQFNISITKN